MAKINDAFRSQVKVIAEPNSSLGQQSNNPLDILGSLLGCPQGDGNPAHSPHPTMPGVTTISKPGIEMDAGSDKNLSTQIMSQVQQDELLQLQKQYPHLKEELAYLMQKQMAGEAADGVGAAGPRGGK